MASNTLNCHLCHKALVDDEASLKQHLSSFHVKYWPYSCTTCYEKGSIHKEATEEAMEEHIATSHCENNSGYYVPKKTEKYKKKEAELKSAIAQCRRSSALQDTSTNPTNALHQDLNFTHNRATDIENDIGNEQIPYDSKGHLRQVPISLNSIPTLDIPVANEPNSIGVKHESFNSAIQFAANGNIEGSANEQPEGGTQPRGDQSLGQQHCAVNSPENVPESKPQMPPVSFPGPTTILETDYSNEQSIDPMNSFENKTSLNAMRVIKPELSEIVSTVPLGVRLQTSLSSFVPIDVDANEMGGPINLCDPNIPRKKRTQSDVASGAISRKRKLPLENCERLPIKAKGPTADTRANPNQCLLEMSQSSTCNPDKNGGSQTLSNKIHQPLNSTTTTAQLVLDVARDPVQKRKITKIWIGIGSGRMYFKTSDGKEHPTRPLRKYLSILRQSEPDVLGCEAHIMFGSLHFERDHPENARKKFEKFSRDVHSIAHLWANGRVVAELHGISEYENNVLSVWDICKKLFSRGRSILECKELEIKLENNHWPLSVVTNVANRCNKLVLKEIHLKNQPLDLNFLDALYEMTLPRHIETTLEFQFDESVENFMDELKERFHSQPSAGQHIKFQLLSPCPIAYTCLQNKYCTLSMERVSPYGRHLYNVVIKPRRNELSTQNSTTSAQVALDAPTGPAQKMKISKIWIDISTGITKFQTSESMKQPPKTFYDSAPLCEYLWTLRQSEADEAGCEAHIVFQTPGKSKNGKVAVHPESAIATRQKFEKFSEEIHFISHLWANGRVVADLWEYSKHENKVLPVWDFCQGLFSRDRSILACKELKIRVGDGWPLCVITNVANRCNKIVLKEFDFVVYRDQRLRSYFLAALYEMKLPHHIEVTLKLYFSKSTKQFIDELKTRFQRSTGQCFKFQLLSKREIAKTELRNQQSLKNSEIPKLLLRNDYGTLETKILESHSNRHDRTMIEQRSYAFVPNRR
ncbi:hypothetical protein Ddc_14247 [Ditylenchus destructor]|nr:hypothetical protein Ddc_14247 [Ditylenchus destructor]